MFVAFPDRDFAVLYGSTLEFRDVETLRSNSSNSATLLTIDDKIAEPCESFICTLQGGALDHVRSVEPKQVTVRICDDDGEHNVHMYCMYILYKMTIINIYHRAKTFSEKVIGRLLIICLNILWRLSQCCHNNIHNKMANRTHWEFNQVVS